MSENKDTALLDRELARMAGETPEVPADFHARWTEQIRAEGAKQKTESKKESRRQWRYILSAAAVFVFLIGGTLLTRNTGRKNPGVNAPAAKTQAQEDVNTEPAGSAPAEDVGDTDAAAGDTGAENALYDEFVPAAESTAKPAPAGHAGGSGTETGNTGAAEAPGAENSMKAARYDEALPQGVQATQEPSVPGNEAAENAAAYMDESVAVMNEPTDDEAAEDAAAYMDESAAVMDEPTEDEAAGDAAVYMGESAAVMNEPAEDAAEEKTAAGSESAPYAQASAAYAAPETAEAEGTALPVEEPAAEEPAAKETTAEETALPTGEPAAEEAPAEDGLVPFLKDLGIFTLKTLGVAAACAALAFLVAVIHRGWKKRKNGKG